MAKIPQRLKWPNLVLKQHYAPSGAGDQTLLAVDTRTYVLIELLLPAVQKGFGASLGGTPVFNPKQPILEKKVPLDKRGPYFTFKGQRLAAAEQVFQPAELAQITKIAARIPTDGLFAEAFLSNPATVLRNYGVLPEVDDEVLVAFLHGAANGGSVAMETLKIQHEGSLLELER